MSIFPRLNQRTKILLPIRTNLATYNEIPEHTVISANTEIPSVQDGPTVVARYRNLTIGEGTTLTTQHRCCGLVVVVDGDLTVNGTISMTARGANYQPSVDHRITNELLPGNDVYYEIDIPATADEIAAFLLKEKRRYHSLDELPAIYRPSLYARGPQGNVYAPADLGVIPVVGGAGGAGRPNIANANGLPGTDGTDRKCGGGGGGGRNNGTSGSGSAGTCYSGGSGGGGAASNSSMIGGNGELYGGSGGNGAGAAETWTAGGGAGNPGGTNSQGGSASSGTGGLLIIVCSGCVTVNGDISSRGSNGGSAARAGGGGSGGGSINVFYGNLTNNGTIAATGGAGGSGSNVGGAGGAGCVTLDQYNF